MFEQVLRGLVAVSRPSDCLVKNLLTLGLLTGDWWVPTVLIWLVLTLNVMILRCRVSRIVPDKFMQFTLVIVTPTPRFLRYWMPERQPCKLGSNLRFGIGYVVMGGPAPLL